MSNLKEILKSSLIILSLLLMFFFGYLFGKNLGWQYFDLSKEIKVFDFISIVTTLLVGLYIAKVLDKRKQENRAEKDMIIRQLDRIITNTEDFVSNLQSLEYNYNTATSGITRIKRAINCVFVSIETANYKILMGPDKGDFSKIIQRINYSTTSTPTLQELKSNPEIIDNIKVSKNIVKISSTQLSLIDTEIESLINKIFLLQVKINKH